ncbi:Uroporphyrinogen-III synthase [Fodinibius roseus]|uniref:Uroporphyrinogen-III synthase n=1 Tax=Fodinibius roseus TaxID=1194090 RepID=A0A1M4UHE3_9BACT|nr:uroporphyrinogen-III synthase [Fodinibius roseus]SHE56117.1 Uroporphyrinogen-III synthase [Fodinibius roseus]
MSQSVLLTAAVEDTEVVRSELKKLKITPLHYPLERYEAVEADKDTVETLELVGEFENIVYGSKRNARFFVEKVKAYDKLEEVREQLNLAADQHTADYLEGEGIPAVHPHSDGNSIDLMEFMLRIRRIGETLYPCGDKTAEDLPGLLKELDVPVEELVLFTLEGPKEEDLQAYRKDLSAHEPEIVIFHSRRSVNRTLAAFPSLNYGKVQVISGDQAVTDKLKREDIETDRQATGNWNSILEEMAESG